MDKSTHRRDVEHTRSEAPSLYFGTHRDKHKEEPTKVLTISPGRVRLAGRLGDAESSLPHDDSRCAGLARGRGDTIFAAQPVPSAPVVVAAAKRDCIPRDLPVAGKTISGKFPLNPHRRFSFETRG